MEDKSLRLQQIDKHFINSILNMRKYKSEKFLDTQKVIDDARWLINELYQNQKEINDYKNYKKEYQELLQKTEQLRLGITEYESRLNQLIKENEEIKKTLYFYSEKENYHSTSSSPSVIEMDNGKKANDVLKKTIRKENKETYSEEELKILWEKLSTGTSMIPDEHGELVINEDFLHFEKGTKRMDIWLWFDDIHPKGISGLLYS